MWENPLKKPHTKRQRLAIACLVLGLLYATTYIPQRVITTSPSDVSRIHVFDGQSGYEVSLSERRDIDSIMRNLNDITFQKGKPSFGYMGYSYRVTLYDEDGDELDEFIINSETTLRYHGFFHTAKSGNIDYDTLDKWMAQFKTHYDE
ncbi:MULTISPECIES: hypothetical protein [unclassified Exiguobacterium]|uniref:hypothetical protein n=1 Tax=unclassified Exiguobacterium TaxID=2644629 RepID=UPI00103FA0A2|nr:MULTISPECIES: hypothetical protein [unclassified Exiguobacterium]TCI35699.1 hypothetical protein EVJ29_09585 [Exiguobacterium sp. SH4S7]TCI65224.1 hypothetical protein EVJ21_01100 [Exiguobacterium sp. SH0S2]TCI80355.1 hypothetical protein EVJ20_03320 [Exiguobacterium sp. SH0S1]